MEFKSLKKVNNNQYNPSKQLKVDLMKLKRKSMKLRKISSISLVMKLSKLKRSLTLSDLRFKISETNSKLTYPTLMMTTCQLNKSWILITNLINTMLSCKLLKNKLRKMQNSKTYLNWKEEITSH